jgi:Uma2 family endonuclease
MSISTPRSRSVSPAVPNGHDGAVPPLKDGDHLTRDEFMRRYEAMPDLKKAELIEGMVHVPSPVRHRHHGNPHATLVGWLFYYRARTPGTELGDNSTVLLDVGSAPQPDAVFFIQPDRDGQVTLDVNGYIVGAPELVAEVAASSVSYDLHEKLRAYERNGVCEYIVWRIDDREVDWFILRNSRFEKLAPDDGGILNSKFFPGLKLDPAALVREDFDRLLAVLQSGLESPEHAEFVGRLQRAGTKAASRD